ncbi:carboxypeptidase-like regulatory domain-containing protein [Lutimonas sp.]|uniref:carboxypeptidase-like regulatory domain-containing protein n=1 Tax=Lutimonas sp. TaxID=1872403 RepID=UPI003D9B6C1B
MNPPIKNLKKICLYVLVSLSMLLYVDAKGQETILTGTVIDAETLEILPYVNIGIKKKGIGTVSDVKGKFKLKLDPSQYQNDTLIFSHIGFETQKVPLKEFDGLVEIRMRSVINDLQEVVVLGKAPKEKKIGRHSKGLGLTHANFYTYYEKGVDDRLSKEKGMKFRIKKNCFLKSLNFNVSSNEFESLKFRINFYKLEDGIPTELIVKKNIIFEINNAFLGWFSVDLQPYEIYLEKELEDVVVSIQWVESVKLNEKSKYFSLSTATSATEKAYSRDKAMDSWTSHGQSMSFYLDALCN